MSLGKAHSPIENPTDRKNHTSFFENYQKNPPHSLSRAKSSFGTAESTIHNGYIAESKDKRHL